MTKNLFGKSKEVESPYATYKLGDFEWRILKTYQRKDKEDTNEYARWFTVARSPHTYGSWEYGDMYIKELMSIEPELTQATPKWRETYE